MLARFTTAGTSSGSNSAARRYAVGGRREIAILAVIELGAFQEVLRRQCVTGRLHFLRVRAGNSVGGGGPATGSDTTRAGTRSLRAG